ncbi:hypothetical protein L7F22_030602 [Adiantum nelumboides]|nr:hypothetical protein [Adiantum nelumboides]
MSVPEVDTEYPFVTGAGHKRATLKCGVAGTEPEREKGRQLTACQGLTGDVLSQGSRLKNGGGAEGGNEEGDKIVDGRQGGARKARRKSWQRGSNLAGAPVRILLYADDLLWISSHNRNFRASYGPWMLSVLEAVGRGETIVSALQEACPEDVREKMATAASAAVQARGISMKLAGFGKNMPAPKLPAGMVEKIQQKLSSLVHDKSPTASMHGTAQIMSDPVAHGSNPPAGTGDRGNTSVPNDEAQKVSQEALNTKQPESCTSALPGGQAENGAATESSSKAGSDAQQRVVQAEKQRQDDVSLVTDRETKDIEVDRNKSSESISMQAEKQGDSSPQEEQKAHGLEQKQENSVATVQTNEPQSENKNDTATNANLNDPNKSTSEQSVGENSHPPALSPSSPASPLPSIDISQAFEALTGVDDSTQMAVTNVFGVIENVLEQLEKDQGQKDAPLPQGQEERVQNQKDEHLKQSSPPVYESSMDGKDMETQKHSFSKASREDMSRKLGLSEGMTREDCPGRGSDELKEELKNSQKGSFKDVDKLEDGTCFSNSSSEEKSSSSAKKVEFDDANLALEYFEDENVWKLIEGSTDNNSIQNGKIGGMDEDTTSEKSNPDMGTFMEESPVIDPEYILLDDAVKHIQSDDIVSNKTVQCDDKSSDSSYGSLISGNLDVLSPLQMKVYKLVMSALGLELMRRLGNSEMMLLGNPLECDIEAVSLTMAKTAGIGLRADYLNCADEEVLQKRLNETIDEEDKMQVDIIVNAINQLYGELAVLPSVLPGGVLLGIILAALSPLGIIGVHEDRKMFVQDQQEGSSSMKSLSLVQTSQKPNFLETKKDRDVITSRQLLSKPHDKLKRNVTSDKVEDMGRGSCNMDVTCLNDAEPSDRKVGSAENATSTGNMMGAMAAAVGATAALAGQENFGRSESNGEGGSQVFTNEAVRNVVESDYELMNQDENKASIVSTLAEKAMSVAAPMVPTKRDGGVDHERLVDILAGIGQKGGILRFVGKMALLWGGLRGAMSLTDRLLVFLRISDRPLYQSPELQADGGRKNLTLKYNKTGPLTDFRNSTENACIPACTSRQLTSIVNEYSPEHEKII